MLHNEKHYQEMDVLIPLFLFFLSTNKSTIVLLVDLLRVFFNIQLNFHHLRFQGFILKIKTQKFFYIILTINK